MSCQRPANQRGAGEEAKQKARWPCKELDFFLCAMGCLQQTQRRYVTFQSSLASGEAGGGRGNGIGGGD